MSARIVSHFEEDFSQRRSPWRVVGLVISVTLHFAGLSAGLVYPLLDTEMNLIPTTAVIAPAALFPNLATPTPPPTPTPEKTPEPSPTKEFKPEDIPTPATIEVEMPDVPEPTPFEEPTPDWKKLRELEELDTPEIDVKDQDVPDLEKRKDKDIDLSRNVKDLDAPDLPGEYNPGPLGTGPINPNAANMRPGDSMGGGFNLKFAEGPGTMVMPSGQGGMWGRGGQQGSGGTPWGVRGGRGKRSGRAGSGDGTSDDANAKKKVEFVSLDSAVGGMGLNSKEAAEYNRLKVTITNAMQSITFRGSFNPGGYGQCTSMEVEGGTVTMSFSFGLHIRVVMGADRVAKIMVGLAGDSDYELKSKVVEARRAKDLLNYLSSKKK